MLNIATNPANRISVLMYLTSPLTRSSTSVPARLGIESVLLAGRWDAVAALWTVSIFKREELDVPTSGANIHLHTLSGDISHFSERPKVRALMKLSCARVLENSTAT